MADVTLKDGREIDFDLTELSISEFRSLRDPYEPEYEGDVILGKVSGLTPEEVGKLGFLEFRRFLKAFYTAAYSADPEKN